MIPTPEEAAEALWDRMGMKWMNQPQAWKESCLRQWANAFRERDAAVHREAMAYWPEMKINAARREQREHDEQIALSHRNVTAQLIAVDIRNGHAKEFVEPWSEVLT